MKPNREILTLGGREFSPMTVSTIEHDFWLMSRIRAAGLDALEKGADETADAFVMRVMHQMIASGNAFELLAGMLLPVNLPAQQWTPERAAETAAFIRALSDPADKAKIHTQMVALLIGFFENGLASVTISRKFSGSTEHRPAIVVH